MAATVDAEPLPARTTPAPPEPSAAELLRAVELIRGAINPVVLAGNGVARDGRRAGAARVRPRHRHRRRRDVHGQGRARLRGPALARHGRPAVARLRARRLRGRRRRDHRRLRPRRARARELEPRGATSGSSASTPSPAEVDEHFITEVDLIGDLYHILSRLAEELRDAPARDAALAAARHRPRPLRGRQGRRRVPDAAAARAVGDPPGAGRARHPDLRRRPAQAVDRAHVPRARAQHRADRQRPGGHGHRAADGDRGQARPPRPPGRHRQRRRRLPHELPGARDRHAPEDADRQRDLGEPAVRLDRLEAGQEVRPPLRRRLHQPRLRQARRGLRHAGVALRVGRRTSATACATR